MAVLLFAVILVALVLVHELGHFLVAKWTGMRVDEFGIGFPPRLIAVRKGETEYSFNALPIGGFVRIYGEDPTETDATDRARAFSRRPRWAQALVLIAGVVMNVLFAWVLFTTALAVGVETAVAPEEASAEARLTVVEVLADSPAAEAGIPTGASVLALERAGETFTPRSAEAFREVVQNPASAPVTVRYMHDGTEHTTTLLAAQDVVADAPEQVAVGVALALVETRSLPLGEAFVEGGAMTVRGLHDITVGITTLIRDAVLGAPDLSQVAGPVGIVGLVDDASAFGLIALVTFTAFISLNLAVINLLPFPALDGGRLLFVAIEAVTRRQIPPRVASYANATGFALLLLLMVAITIHDVVRLG